MKTKDINTVLLASGIVLSLIVGYAIYDITDSLHQVPEVVMDAVPPVVIVQIIETNKTSEVLKNRKQASAPVVNQKVEKKVQVAAKFDLPGIDGNRLFDYLETAENPDGDPELVGDRKMKHKAYGLLQIRQPCLSDVIKVARKDMISKWGRVLTIKDMKDRNKARWVARVYLWHYGKEYTRKTGKIPTMKIYAKIHNGGPEGWHPRNMDTRRYWAMVVRMNGLEMG